MKVQDLLNEREWTDDLVQRSGMQIFHAPVVSIGGGYGSFAVVNLLRTAGMATNDIAVVSRNAVPHETYSFLARNSQIRDADRLRSDSSAMPDNLWGFPSYALREAVRGRVQQAARVCTEPVLMEFFTPVSGTVYAATEKEARRIGWSSMVFNGQARAIRPRRGGGYYTLCTTTTETTKERFALQSRYVHLAPGYAGAQFLPDLQEYRDRTGDVTRVVNAYEHHEHVYLDCERSAKTVVVRGAGIVASRVLQRLLDAREDGRANTTVIHLFRSYATDRGSGRRAKVDLGFTQQPFNLCKSAFGGSMAERIEREPDARQRVAMMRESSGTTTARRKSWFRQLKRGQAGGYYQQRVGKVLAVDGAEQLRIEIAGDTGNETIVADYIIDATGLQGGVRDHRLLRDLVDTFEVPLNPMQRVATTADFEIEPLRNDPGSVFLTGAMSMGNYFGPVDSFYGLQWAAWRVVDRMAADGAVRRIGSIRSLRGWLKRMRGAAP